MADETWHYLENQFDSVTKGRRGRMDSILNDTYVKLNAAVGQNAAYLPIRDGLSDPKTAWETAYADWKNKRANWRGATQALENLLSALSVAPAPGSRSKIDKWESRIANYWAVTHPIYATLLPRGRDPFTEGTRDSIIDEVEQFGVRVAAKSVELLAAAGDPNLPPAEAAELTEQGNALAVLGTEVTAFHGELNGARTAQQQQEGMVDQCSASCEQKRVDAADALYKVLAQLMAMHWTKEARPMVAGFFDLTLLMETSQPGDEEEEEPQPPEGGGTPPTP